MRGLLLVRGSSGGHKSVSGVLANPRGCAVDFMLYETITPLRKAEHIIRSAGREYP